MPEAFQRELNLTAHRDLVIPILDPHSDFEDFSANEAHLRRKITSLQGLQDDRYLVGWDRVTPSSLQSRMFCAPMSHTTATTWNPVDSTA